jgi:3',5'-cyclic AMP phosphodiesterase CpdA
MRSTEEMFMAKKVKKRHVVRNSVLIVLAAVLVVLIGWKLISGYIAALPKYSYDYGTAETTEPARYPDASFAVISDCHYYDTSLGTTGAAYEACLYSDRKLLKESAFLVQTAVDRIVGSGVKFVLVCGDVTKDGELVAHQKVTEQLQRLVDSGLKVYIVPGNHDVNNPDAVRYDGDTSSPVPTVSASDYASMYANFGYKDALMRDPGSLSYVAEPQEGLWIVALDTCEYEKNQPGKEEVWAGELTQDQLNWTEDVFRQANSLGKAVVVLEHHGVVEHWRGQSRLHPDYLLSDYKYVQKLYSSYGVRLAFTGHYHAKDIALFKDGTGGCLYDIETGSLSTPPCPIRFCTIADNSISIRTVDILDSLGADKTEPAMAFVSKTIYDEAYRTLKKYYVSDQGADYIANRVAEAFFAHYGGDENEAGRVPVDKNKLTLWDRLIYSQYQYAVNGLWKDLPPVDNTCTLNLSSAT